MRLFYSDDHEGHYPVGVCSIVVAPDEEAARELLSAALIDRGFRRGDFTLTEIDATKAQALVVRDGNY